MKYNILPLVLLGLAASALPSFADLDGTEAAVILELPHSRTGVGAGTQTRGYTFTLDTPRTLTHLGMFIYNGTAGANVPRQVGLWDAAGTLLTEVTIPVEGGEIEDLGGGSKFTYLAPDPPVILLPEVVYTVAVWYSDNNSPGLAFNVPFTTIEGFTYLSTVETGPPGGAFAQPTIERPDRLGGYVGPNLRFDEAIPVLSQFTLNELSLDPATDRLTIKWDSESGKIYRTWRAGISTMWW